VAVVGGGLAGLTAALRLAQRGFAVTVYEAKETLGGNFSANDVHGVYHDVYPHMFCPWYSNFWQVFGEINHMEPDAARALLFDPREGVKFQDKDSTNYLELQNGTTLRSVLANLNSKVESWPDMFLLGFSMLDFLSISIAIPPRKWLPCKTIS
jgi:phytoene dehydrogenase-like protein